MKQINLNNIDYKKLSNEINCITTNNDFWNNIEIFFKKETSKRIKDFQKYKVKKNVYFEI